MPQTLELKVVNGDATDPQGEGHKLIVHVCNDVGAWGAGFVLALSKRWPSPEAAYHHWYRIGRVGDPAPFRLGEIQLSQVTDDITVVNMIAQSGIFRAGPRIRYDALRLCLETVARIAKQRNASVHMPRIGCGLAGGTWDDVGPIVQETLVDQGIETTVYDFAP